MGKDTKIEWCDHSWSPWRGCTRVSRGCAHCYAEKLSHRNPKVLGVWGDRGTRVVASEAKWREPLAWDRAAREAGERRRVFPSLCDPFEDRPELVGPRARLFRLILATPNLDWLLLTKRPENIARLWPAGHEFTGPGAVEWPNIWLGSSAEDQETYDARRESLDPTLAAVLWWSLEPLLGPIRIGLMDWWDFADGSHTVTPRRDNPAWVVVGGESGPKARPMDPDWARSIRDECVAAGVPLHFKQWGEWIPFGQLPAGWSRTTEAIHGWGDDGVSYRVGKKAAGRMLDGRTWDELPRAGKAVAG